MENLNALACRIDLADRSVNAAKPRFAIFP